ncbi:MBL fold metallo-hydrolase [Propioniciclava coleopterorum]|uniref:MBL fold metallo-hydrolase n=1 Tax=Propioniciclava coleopterorum TaxID=2714937 RepID=A0A6G7Y931_9ACTN|nr:MBL fold metallo-hydrolase [Propioniciclava coleopterorum]QIK73315.1 MBL fold metallo-hydrolase [Propioniciclava coleopterorum]
MFRVVALPAGPGDAVIVEYGPARAPRRLLIDAGPRHAWAALAARLRRRAADRYEVLVVTHVDEDHIGGVLELLDDPGLAPRVQAVWFNGYVHCERGGNVLGPVHGEQLTRRIVDLAVPWNPGWPRPVGPGLGGPVVAPVSGPLPALDLPGGARAVLLGPAPAQLKRLARTWRDVVTKAGLVPGAGAEGDGAAVRQRPRTWGDLPATLDAAALARLAAGRSRDGSAANGSSIAVVLEFEGRRVLLPGDAHGPPLAAAIARYGAEVGESRPRFDLVKLPHHGSGANVTDELVASWLAHRFLVSTDGTGYAHPDDAAIARLILAAETDRPEFHANHPGGGLARWSARAGEVAARFVFPRTPAAGLTVTV